MGENSGKKESLLKACRWITRIIGSVVSLFLIFLMITYTINPSDQSDAPGIVVTASILLWAIGNASAWKWEGLGGLIILIGSLLYFLAKPEQILHLSLFHIMLPIGILFIYYRQMSKKIV